MMQTEGVLHPVWSGSNAHRAATALLGDCSAWTETDTHAHAHAHTDADADQEVTGLPGIDVLASTLHSLGDRAERILLAYVDIDRLHVVNDRFGRPAGDAVLQAVASRLVAGAGPDNLVVRVDGDDEFMVMFTDMPTNLREIRERLERALKTPIPIGDQELSITGSVGFAVGRAKDHRHLIASDRQMFSAKRPTQAATMGLNYLEV